MIVDYKHLRRPRFVVEFSEQKIYHVIWRYGVNEFGNTSGMFHPFRRWMNDNGFGDGEIAGPGKNCNWRLDHLQVGRPNTYAVYFDDYQLALKFDAQFGSNLWLADWLKENVKSNKYKIMN